MATISTLGAIAITASRARKGFRTEEQHCCCQHTNRYKNARRHTHDTVYLALTATSGRLGHHFGQRRRQADCRNHEHRRINTVGRTEQAKRRRFLPTNQVLQRDLEERADNLDD